MLNDINLFSHGYHYVVWYLRHANAHAPLYLIHKIDIIMISFMRNPFVIIVEDMIK